MITEIEIENFKSLEKVRLKLGKFNLFVGANASGKSNFFDALRVLQGIGYGLTVDEIFNGKPKSATNVVWDGIRGGSGFALSFDQAKDPEGAGDLKFCVKVQKDAKVLAYSVTISPSELRLASESLEVDSRVVYASTFTEQSSLPVVYHDDDGERCFTDAESSRSALHQLLAYWYFSSYHKDTIEFVSRSLSDMQAIDPKVEILRTYSQAHSAQRIGERGENFAAVVSEVLANASLGSAYLSWLQHLLPTDLNEIVMWKGALGEPLFAVEERAHVVPAPILSDGSLRFAALVAAFFQPDMPRIIKLEEVENGIHPARLRLLVELLKSQSSETGPQVFATTHSPVILAWLDEKDYETTFLCKRDEETGASIITPLSEIPHLVEVVKKSSLGELFTQGWMEMAL